MACCILNYLVHDRMFLCHSRKGSLMGDVSSCAYATCHVEDAWVHLQRDHVRGPTSANNRSPAEPLVRTQQKAA